MRHLLECIATNGCHSSSTFISGRAIVIAVIAVASCIAALVLLCLIVPRCVGAAQGWDASLASSLRPVQLISGHARRCGESLLSVENMHAGNAVSRPMAAQMD